MFCHCTLLALCFFGLGFGFLREWLLDLSLPPWHPPSWPLVAPLLISFGAFFWSLFEALFACTALPWARLGLSGALLASLGLFFSSPGAPLTSSYTLIGVSWLLLRNSWGNLTSLGALLEPGVAQKGSFGVFQGSCGPLLPVLGQRGKKTGSACKPPARSVHGSPETCDRFGESPSPL
jgi:hypothetical protein